MLRNRGWDRPQDWGAITANEKDQWHEIADNLEQFYRDMRTHRHINVSLSSFMTPDEERSYRHFIKTLEDQDKIYRAGNMLSQIAASSGGSKHLVSISQGMLNDEDLPYVYLSTFAFILIQAFESNLNVLKKTITTMALTTRSGRQWDKSVEDTSPVRLLEMLRRYSQASVSYLEENLFKHGSLRNAFSHGLFWYEDEQIFWIDNVNSPDSHTMPFIDLFRIFREQTLFAQCFLWVGAKLLAEKFFEP
jgi:hypothetical protein